MEQENKVVRLNENPLENEEQVEVDDGAGDEGNDNELSHMDKLPNEILIKILDYLDERKLVKCRPLNSRWNEICCLLLQEKTTSNRLSKLVVHLRKVHDRNYLECATVKQGSFSSFLQCFSPSEAEKSCNFRRPFPFSCLDIADLHCMDMNQMTQFVPLFIHINSLFVDVKEKDLTNFATFCRLVLKFAPNIEHLGLRDNKWCRVNLFEPYFHVMGQSDLFEKMSDKSTVFNKLKVLDIDDRSSPIADFLNIALNLQELGHHNSFYLLTFRQQQDQAHLVKRLEIRPSSQSALLPVDLMKYIGIENLCAGCGVPSDSDFDSVEDEKSTTNYIYHALKSSRETLSSLMLYNLTVESMNRSIKDISSLPNVRQLQIYVQISIEFAKILEKSSHLCPNITSLILGSLEGCFSQVAPVLWTRFKGLKSLKFPLDFTDDKNNFLLVDSAFSGYSEESIQKIQAKLDNGISLEEARRGEAQKPSILDLKDLSRLQLDVFLEVSQEPEKKKHQLENSVFVKLLPQHIRENPRSIVYREAIFVMS